jgi:hypothetical protein
MTALSRQFCAGAIFVLIGLFGVFAASNYQLGSATHMGPGYFPICLSILLAVLGLVAMVQSLLRHPQVRLPSWEWRDLAFMTLGAVLFGLLIDRAGLLAASAGLILPACYARLRRHPIEVAVLWLALTGFAGAIFIDAFGMPFAWY